MVVIVHNDDHWERVVDNWKYSQFLSEMVDDDDEEEVRVDIGLVDTSITLEEFESALRYIDTLHNLQTIRETFHHLRDPDEIKTTLHQMNHAYLLRNIHKNHIVQWLNPDDDALEYARDVCKILDLTTQHKMVLLKRHVAEYNRLYRMHRDACLRGIRDKLPMPTEVADYHALYKEPKHYNNKALFVLIRWREFQLDMKNRKFTNYPSTEPYFTLFLRWMSCARMRYEHMKMLLVHSSVHSGEEGVKWYWDTFRCGDGFHFRNEPYLYARMDTNIDELVRYHTQEFKEFLTKEGYISVITWFEGVYRD